MSYAKKDFRIRKVVFDVHYKAPGPWYIATGDPLKYLHSDCEIRRGTEHDGLWSGFYASKRDAQQTLDQFLFKQADLAAQQYLATKSVPCDEKPVIDYAFVLSRMLDHSDRLRLAEASIKDFENQASFLSQKIECLESNVPDDIIERVHALEAAVATMSSRLRKIENALGMNGV